MIPAYSGIHGLGLHRISKPSVRAFLRRGTQAYQSLDDFTMHIIGKNCQLANTKSSDNEPLLALSPENAGAHNASGKLFFD